MTYQGYLIEKMDSGYDGESAEYFIYNPQGQQVEAYANALHGFKSIASAKAAVRAHMGGIGIEEIYYKEWGDE